MIHSIWIAVFYRPLVNILLLAISIMPKADVGFAIILITLLIKFALAPLTKRAIESQIKIKEIEPEVNKIKSTVTDKTLQQKQIYALYAEKKVNPFSSCLPMIVQILVLGSLYFIFRHGFSVISDSAYTFIHVIKTPNPHFLGYFDVTQKSILLAIIAGITQYFQGFLAKGRQGTPSGDGMAGEFAKTMQTQMLYVLPLMVMIFAYQISTAVALYFVTSNIFTIGQELYLKRQAKEKAQLTVTH